jgi:hypothetical protein
VENNGHSSLKSRDLARYGNRMPKTEYGQVCAPLVGNGCSHSSRLNLHQISRENGGHESQTWVYYYANKELLLLINRNK